MDIQECPKADMAIVALLVHLLKIFDNEKFISNHDQQQWDTEALNAILQTTIKYAEHAIIDNTE